MSRNKYPEETIQLILDVAQKLFLTKGYENTSIQDIINGLGGLSKGAVYHHFKSKEDIFDAVGTRYNAEVIEQLRLIVDDRRLSGYGKLQKMFQLSLSTSDRDIMFTVTPNMLDNPKLLAMQIREIFYDVVPYYIQPVIEEGIRDGSIVTEYPKELAEVITLLANIWLNPLIIEADAESMERRVRFFNSILRAAGINLLDEQMLDSYKRFCALSEKSKQTNT
ncbi:MAG: TetR/AcrR family transcriptional regulator [Lachnospiraceae bacterium]|nr:TetR/AcrR family transcriptional regulator [Lachnospiraceae bacterium]